MIEIPQKRTMRGKVFQISPTQRKAVTGIAPIHVPDDFTAFKAAARERDYKGSWSDGDCTVELKNGFYSTKNCYYDVQIDPNLCKYSYVSKSGGDAAVELLEINGAAPPTFPAPRLDGDKIWWDDVLPGLDLYIHCRLLRVRIFKRVRSGSFPLVFKWRLDEGDMSNLVFKVETTGKDNHDLSNPGRSASLPRNQNRELEITNPRSVPVLRQGKMSSEVLETITGRTVRINPVTRIKSFVNQIAFPVLVDQDLTETIAANGDDGYQNQDNAKWYTDWIGSSENIVDFGASGNKWGGWRFAAVPVAQGSDVTLAEFIHDTNNGTATGGLCVISGDDVDDAAVWADSDGPADMADTTANASEQFTRLSLLTLDVTSIIDEIINRSGWVSNNDLRIGFSSQTTDTKYCFVGDYNGSVAAILEITYDAPGISIPVAMNSYRQRHQSWV